MFTPLLPRILRYTALSLSPLLMASSAIAAGFTALNGDCYNGYFNGSPGYFSSNTKAFTRQDNFIAFTDPTFRTSYPNTLPNAGYVDWGFTGTPLNGVSDFFQFAGQVNFKSTKQERMALEPTPMTGLSSILITLVSFQIPLYIPQHTTQQRVH